MKPSVQKLLKTTLLLLIAYIWGCGTPHISNSPVTSLPSRTTSLLSNEVSNLDSVDIHFQVLESCYAYSGSDYTQASNGEYQSDNLPNKVDDTFPDKGFYLVANQDELVKIDSLFLGHKLYLVNTTWLPVELPASDSRLYIRTEALNRNQKWTTISYHIPSGCGNSYHTVTLDANEFWNFDVPIFKGNFKTKLRYTLDLDKDTQICSNEIVAYLNEEQFDADKKQGYIRSNLMDPYGN